MTVPTFWNLDNGFGDTTISKAIVPFVVLTLQLSPRFIIEAGGGGGGSPPTSGQLWPRRA